jgi:hypothetical protein
VTEHTEIASQATQRDPSARSEVVKVRLSPNLVDAIGEAARRRGMTISEWLRQAARTVTVLEGIGFPDATPAGTHRYARIMGGAIADVRYIADNQEAAR